MKTEQRLVAMLTQHKIQYKALIRLMGDASTRVYYRIVSEEAVYGGEKTLIAMVLPEKIEINEGGRSDFITEEPFFHVYQYLKGSDLNIAEVYLFDREARIMILEDLGDLTLYEALNQGKIELETMYRGAIDQLIRFQGYTQQNIDPKSYLFQRKFDYDTLYWELEHYVEWYCQEGNGIQYSDREQGEIGEAFKRLTNEILAMPQITVHRDFQSKNLMLKNQKFYLIDFQDALQGSYVYDLVALLKDSYVVLEEPFVQQMLQYYIAQTKAVRGIEYHFDTLYAHFKVQAMQRKLKDTGRFHFIDIVRKNSSFLQYIPASKGYILRYFDEVLPEVPFMKGALG